MNATRIIGNVRMLPRLPIVLTLTAVLSECQAGYDAYFDRRGPGVGRLRCAGWLQAYHDERAELEARQEERRSQF